MQLATSPPIRNTIILNSFPIVFFFRIAQFPIPRLEASRVSVPARRSVHTGEWESVVPCSGSEMAPVAFVAENALVLF